MVLRIAFALGLLLLIGGGTAMHAVGADTSYKAYSNVAPFVLVGDWK